MCAKLLGKNKQLFIIIGLVLFLELVFLNYLTIANIHPDIFLILIVFLPLYFEKDFSKRPSLYICLFLGMLRDILSSAPLGLYILGFLLSRFIVGELKRRIYPGRIIIDAVFVFITALVLFFYLALISDLKNNVSIPLLLIFGSVLYTTLVSIPLFLVFKKIAGTRTY